MSVGWYCLDNDIILKLATCDLLDETLKSLDIDVSILKILETAKYKFSRLQEREAKRQQGNEPVKYNLASALSIAESCSKISADEVNQNLWLELQNIEGIDAGEAILISYVSYLNQQGDPSYLLTGDKRCLRALANCGIAKIVEPLHHQIWCLEQLILKNIEVHSFDLVKQKIVPVKDCDTALKAIFGSGELATLEASQVALTAYIEDLRQHTGNLLHSYPEDEDL
ncbi:hypothetical protein [Merismopedia glauca]|uniref:PIN domain-containing protein n=1 Tax=Merismopedia glauca CCAP 1448/3 TaxID=1296344 RepID=A0A2T1C047_9CYAN|nr:hypothetical protein [Merismopedia glauca]PSB01538.1 hypothetical protein C7B64_17715 [Merismopedia glauca CCAP 1448/3]